MDLERVSTEVLLFLYFVTLGGDRVFLGLSSGLAIACLLFDILIAESTHY